MKIIGLMRISLALVRIFKNIKLPEASKDRKAQPERVAYLHNNAEKTPMTDNDIRTEFIKRGMPDMGFEVMGFAKPTQMERVIFEEDKPDLTYTIYVGIEFSNQLSELIEKMFPLPPESAT
jgi:hypothetical protein